MLFGGNFHRLVGRGGNLFFVEILIFGIFRVEVLFG